ncbi:MAG: hypothetical protein Q7U74_10820, partial [Saprospiraceae bacterium]|nr:hypothetical protein [Saprospiraceae bacterium]
VKQVMVDDFFKDLMEYNTSLLVSIRDGEIFHDALGIVKVVKINIEKGLMVGTKEILLKKLLAIQEYLREIGIKFELEDSCDSLSWERDSYWCYYPEGHLSSSKGTCALYTQLQNKYRIEPKKEWSQDTKSFYYSGIEDEVNGQLANIAKSTKENIIKYSLLKKEQEMISTYSEGDVSGRLNKEGEKLQLYISNQMDYHLDWGNYQRNILLKNEYSNRVTIKINTSVQN